MTTRRGTFLIMIGLGTAVTLVTGTGHGHAEGLRPRAVIELFTSQGCGKCPPADALLTRLAEDPGLVTLSFAVDYWDYLGWKDTAARPEFTQRQRAYAAARGDHGVYTPQVVVNGRTHVVGSDRAAIDTAVAALAATTDQHPVVDVAVETTRDALVVRVADAQEPLAGRHATVWLARYERTRTVPIRNGENTGRTVTYTHLVRSLQPIGMWKGQALRIELPRQDADHVKGEGWVVLVQLDRENGPGAIVGARILDDPSS